MTAKAKKQDNKDIAQATTSQEVAHVRPESAAVSLWQQLRRPFDPKVIGQLPKINCWQCSQAIKDRKGRSCSNHAVKHCDTCGSTMTTAHIHLDFVGHAAVTDRLNNTAGPDNWNWEPLAVDDAGLPKLDNRGNLWIKLSIRESTDKPWTTRLGYGDGSASPKELIGDALRNAAMRFGIALDLWTKDELESTLQDASLKNKDEFGLVPRDASLPISDQERGLLHRMMLKLGFTGDDELELLRANGISNPQSMTSGEARDMLRKLSKSAFTAPQTQAPAASTDAASDDELADALDQGFATAGNNANPAVHVDEGFKAALTEQITSLGFNAQGMMWLKREVTGKPFGKIEDFNDIQCTRAYDLVQAVLNGTHEVPDRYLAGVVSDADETPPVDPSEPKKNQTDAVKQLWPDAQEVGKANVEAAA